jgi:hypothetical protein
MRDARPARGRRVAAEGRVVLLYLRLDAGPPLGVSEGKQGAEGERAPGDKPLPRPGLD